MPDGTYDSIYGGYLYSGDRIVQNNTLNLTDKHTASEILGGIAYDPTVGGTTGSATANKNTINFSGGTCTDYMGGGTAYVRYSTGNGSTDGNSVNLTNVKFTGEQSQVHGGYTYVNRGGSASADNNSLTVNNAADTNIVTIYGGYSFLVSEAYEGAGTATASNNGLGEKQDGTLTNVSCDLFVGGRAYAATADAKAEADSNKFILSGKSYGDVYGGLVDAGDSNNKKQDDDKSVASASSNSITLTAEEITGSVYGGKAEAKGKRQKEEGDIADPVVSCTVNADSNKLVITKTGTGKAGNVTGGYARAEYAAEDSTASASKNTVSIENGSFYTIIGGKAIIGDGETNAGAATASGNAVSLNNVTIRGDVYGGWAKGYTGSADNNSLTIKNDSDTTAASNIYGGYVSYDDGKASASNNGIGEKQDGTLTNVSSELFVGGQADVTGGKAEAQANNNNFSLKGTTYGDVLGGQAIAGRGNLDNGSKDQGSVANASGNTIAIEAQDITNEALGGSADASGNRGDSGYFKSTAAADNNTLSIKKTGDTVTSAVYGGRAQVKYADSESSASASGNVLNMEAGQYSNVYGGYAASDTDKSAATASYNGQGTDKDKTSTLSGITAETFTGGYASTVNGTAAASENKFSFKSSNITEVKGGSAVVEKGESEAGKAKVSGNSITFSNGTAGNVYGGYTEGYASTVSAANNAISLSNSTCTGSVYGASATGYASKEISADSNSVRITDVKFSGDKSQLYGGRSFSHNGGTVTARSNVLTVTNAADSRIAKIYGGYALAYQGGTSYEGTGTAQASYNGGAQDGILTNVSCDVFAGGYAYAATADAKAEALSNAFTLSGKSFGEVYGGLAIAGDSGSKKHQDDQSVATASGNTITITAEEITGDVCGGTAQALGERAKEEGDTDDSLVSCTVAADSNTLTITKTGTGKSGDVYGGRAQVKSADSESSASASGNILNMQDGTYKTIYGGYAASDSEGATVTASYNGQGTAKDKTSTLSGITAESFTGGYAKTLNGDAAASENKFSFTGSNITTVYGGNVVVDKGESEAGKAEASSNSIAFSNGTAKDVYGGYAEGYASTVSADNNAVLLSSSTCTGSVYGASATGYASQKVSADSNSVQIADVKFSGDKSQVYGGKSLAHSGGTATASYNVLTVTNASDSRIAEIYGGHAYVGQGETGYEGSGTAQASYNGDEQDGILTNVSCDVFAGGYAYAATADAKAEALSNIFTLSGKSFGDVYGGQAVAGDSSNKKHQDDQSVATATGNRIKITAEEISGDVCGGAAQAFGERAKEEGDTDDSLVSCTVEADSNNLSITNTGTGKSGDVYGGSAYAKSVASGSSASASENILEIENGTYGTIYSGYAVLDGEGTARASSNDANVTATADCYTGALASVSGGNAEASDNDSYVQGSYSTVTGSQAVVTAGKSAEDTATASGNSLTLDNAEVAGVVYGGIAEAYAAGKAVTEGNSLTLSNGSVFKDEIYAGVSSVEGETGSASSHGNTVNILSTTNAVPTFDEDKTVIWGGYAKVGDKEQASYGNTLSLLNVKGLTAANIRNFGSFQFYLPDMQAEETVLTLTGNDADDKKGTTSIVDAESGKTTVQVKNDVINVTGAKGGEFRSGEKIYLLTNKNGLTANLDGTTTTVKGQTGISLQYDLTLEADGSSLYLTRIANEDPVVLPETKPIAEGAASGLALVNESANTATELLRDFSLTGGQIVPFAHVQASSMRHETGSHINVSAVSFAAGLGTGFETGAGNLSVGAFFEYGRGSYTTHNSFSSRSDVDGDGNSWYMGGGILAKMDFVKTGPGHFYLEGSAHMGSLHNEFDSNDVEYKGRIAQFDMDSPYYSLHGGIGYVWNITEEHDLDVYGKYMWTRVQGTDDTLTTSDKFEYDDMDSNRIRLGARYTYTGSERFRPYVGAAFEHEFAGSCESTVFDHSVSAPSFEGSSGMGEIGLIMTPSETIPLSVNLGVQGYVGQKQGVAGNCSLMYEF